MDLTAQILTEHSKANTAVIEKWIGGHQQRFDALVHLFLNDKEYRVIQRAAWPLSNIVKKYPSLVIKHLDKILKYVKKPGLHEAVKRNTVRLLQDIEIPVK